MITVDEIKRLRELMEKAFCHTEWGLGECDEDDGCDIVVWCGDERGHIGRTDSECDATFIVALVNAAPKLLEMRDLMVMGHPGLLMVMEQRDAALAEVAALKADRDNWIAAAQGLGKANDAALARAGLMEGTMRVILDEPVDLWIKDMIEKALATPANGGEANG